MILNNKMKCLLGLVVTILVQLTVLWQIRSHFIDVAATGRIYRAPAKIVQVRNQGGDYLSVAIQHEDAKWLSADELVPYEKRIYVAVAPDSKGMLMIKGASLEVPAQGDYIATVGSVSKGVASFSIPFTRFYMDRRHLDSLPLEEYIDNVEKTTTEIDGQTVIIKKDVQPKHEIIAEFRLADGDGVITNVYVDGHSLLNLYNTESSNTIESTEKQRKDEKR